MNKTQWRRASVKKHIKTKEEYEKLMKDERIIVLDAALDSQCYFLSPDCSKCTHSVYVKGSKQCIYSLETEKCYISDGKIDFNDSKSLGRPERWKVEEMKLSIRYNKLFKGKFGRSIFTDNTKAMMMASKFDSLYYDEEVIEDSVGIQSYDDYIKLEALNRIVMLPCKIGEKYYVLEPDCTECRYKNDGYKGCGYIHKEGESPYFCAYYNEFNLCRVVNQENAETIYIEPENYGIKENYLMSASQFDLDRKSFYGVWVNRNKLEGILKTVKN